MAKSRKNDTKKEVDSIQNFMFCFKYVNFNIDFDEDTFSDEKKKDITSIVLNASNEIWIDKTYVDFKDTKYKKTFISEDGWKQLCKLLNGTSYGKKASTSERLYLQEAYALMNVCYMYQLLEDLQYDTDGIYLSIKSGTMYMIQIFKDTANAQAYPGKWQTWKMFN